MKLQISFLEIFILDLFLKPIISHSLFTIQYEYNTHIMFKGFCSHVCIHQHSHVNKLNAKSQSNVYYIHKIMIFSC